MSFADGLKNLKGLMASRNGSDDTMGEDSTTADGVTEEDSAIGRRLKAAGTSVCEKGLMKPQPDRRVALLLLIIDSLPFEEFWREWIRRGDGRTQVKVWIHAKFPEKVQSRWVQARLIKRSFRPEWGSVEITRATLELMQCALDESRAQRLILASETCLPVAPLDRAAEQIFADQRSWVCVRCTPNNGYSKQLQFQPLMNAGVPEELIWKADQWWMLTRHHAESVLELKRAYGEDLWPLFKKVSASDEMYIPTCLALLGAIARGEDGESMVSEVITRRRVTYSFWGDSPKSPETFEGLDEGVLKAAMEEGCLFARKFKGGIVPWESWMAQMRSLGDSSYGTADEDPLPRLEIELVDPQQSTRKRKHGRE